MTKVMMKAMTKMGRGAWLWVAPLVIGLAGASYGQIVVTSTGGSAAPGGDVTVTYAISGTGASSTVATYNAQVSFDATNLTIQSSCLGGSNNGNACTKNADCPGNGLCAANCTKDARLTDQVGQFSRTDVGTLIFFVGDTSFPIASFGDGNMFTCTFTAAAGAAAGSYPLTTTFLEVADTNGDDLTATPTDGSVVVSGGGESTPTATQPEVQATPTATFPAGIVIASDIQMAAAGTDAVVTYEIVGTGASSTVATYNAQISFDSNSLDIQSSCLGGTNNGNACTKNADCPGNGLCSVNCTKDARLTDQVGQFSRADVGTLIFFVGDTSFPIASFGDGNMFTCTFTVKPGAAPGAYSLQTTFLEVADTNGDDLTAALSDGGVVVPGGGGGATPTATQPEVQATPTATFPAGIVIASDIQMAAAGTDAVITYEIVGTGASSTVATYNAQISFDSNSLDIQSSCLGGTNNGNACTKNADCPGNGLCSVNCTKDARLTDQVGQFSRADVGTLIFFVGDTSFPIASFGDGNMFTCTFTVKPGAAPGAYSLQTTFLEVADTNGDDLTAALSDGGVVVPGAAGATPTFTNTVSVPTNTPENTATVTATPVNTATGTATQTQAPSATPSRTASPSPTATTGTSSTLISNITATQGTIPVADINPFNVGDTIQIDNEQMTVTGKTANSASVFNAEVTAGVLAVTRGVNGTTATTHNAGATVSKVTASPTPSSTDEDGCQISARGGGSGAWLLLAPAAGLLVLRRRRR